MWRSRFSLSPGRSTSFKKIQKIKWSQLALNSVSSFPAIDRLLWLNFISETAAIFVFIAPNLICGLDHFILFYSHTRLFMIAWVGWPNRKGRRCSLSLCQLTCVLLRGRKWARPMDVPSRLITHRRVPFARPSARFSISFPSSVTLVVRNSYVFFWIPSAIDGNLTESIMSHQIHPLWTRNLFQWVQMVKRGRALPLFFFGGGGLYIYLKSWSRVVRFLTEQLTVSIRL